jgi:hypothetical protein
MQEAMDLQVRFKFYFLNNVKFGMCCCRQIVILLPAWTKAGLFAGL